MEIKNHWQTILIIILILLLVGLLFYYNVLPKYNQKIAQQGYDVAIQQIYGPVSQCQPVPITFNNQTINIISIECYG